MVIRFDLSLACCWRMASLWSIRRLVNESSAMASWATMGLWCGCWGDMILIYLLKLILIFIGFQITVINLWILVSMFLAMAPMTQIDINLPHHLNCVLRKAANDCNTLHSIQAAGFIPFSVMYAIDSVLCLSGIAGNACDVT